MISALQLFSALGKKSKIAIACRDRFFMRILFAEVDRAVSDDVITRCDKYAADFATRRQRKRER